MLYHEFELVASIKHKVPRGFLNLGVDYAFGYVSSLKEDS